MSVHCGFGDVDVDEIGVMCWVIVFMSLFGEHEGEVCS